MTVFAPNNVYVENIAIFVNCWVVRIKADDFINIINTLNGAPSMKSQ